MSQDIELLKKSALDPVFASLAEKADSDATTPSGILQRIGRSSGVSVKIGGDGKLSFSLAVHLVDQDGTPIVDEKGRSVVPFNL
jgi:hypothetical protein